MRVTVGNSGLCCCTCVTYFERLLTPLCVDSARALWVSFCFRFVSFLGIFPNSFVNYKYLFLGSLCNVYVDEIGAGGGGNGGGGGK